MLSPTVVRCDKEMEILHAVYLGVIILLMIIIVVISVIHWRQRRGPGNTYYLVFQHALLKWKLAKLPSPSKLSPLLFVYLMAINEDALGVSIHKWTNGISVFSSYLTKLVVSCV